MAWDRKAVFDIIAGFLNGGLVMGLMFVVMLAAGLTEFNGLTWWQEDGSAITNFQWSVMTAIVAALGVTALTGWWEELVFRGYLFQNIREGLGLWAAVAISSLLFGFIHFPNPGATVLSSLLISLLIVPFIYAYLKTGQLWFAMGLHMGWNFFQTTLFGFQTSGHEGVSLISHSLNGPDWLTGGAFGAEGSILIVPVGATVFITVHYWNKWNRHPDQRFMETEL
ncbi:MAG: CPBP family intramembrane metalloprotease [Kordiimonadaceae bacterium]|nr:CPBP family intramembrane metalloprotease [Kordiimonadaceae bacterium]